jgi:CheY-like chemotaxis protein
MSFSILVVDDEPDIAEMFRQRFRREVRQGTYVLHFAASGEQALDTLADGVRPELIVILSDINMPGMDGLTLLRETKARTAGHDGDRLWRPRAPPAAAEGGALLFLSKPVDFDFLKQQLRQLPSTPV